ncbi:MAG TPA: ImmA/IrrE family metallo-endopeptidase [Actinomycetota bacterium]
MNNLIADLRALVPSRPLTITESLRLAELQAVKLLAAAGVTKPPVPETVITALPRVSVRRVAPLTISGGAKWIKGLWYIVLNGAEPLARQRFSIGHEFKHVLDAARTEQLYPAVAGMSTEDRAEAVCDFFAANLLMPKVLLRRAWVNKTQDLRALARMFGVSLSAMNVRLQSLGLTEPPARCRSAKERAA